MAEKKLLVPNIGDFKNVEVIEVLVKSGQQIKKNDPLITLESDKSSVEVPATDEGKINKIIVKVGDKVSEGSEILSLDSVSKKEESKKAVEVKENIPEKKIVTETQKEIAPVVKKFSKDGVSSASPKVRKFFEVDKKHIVTYTLSALAKEQLMASEHAEKAIKKYNIDQTKIFPTKL